MSEAKLELIKVETDTEKKYHPKDGFVLKVTLDCHEPIDDDVEFEVTYFGDVFSEHNDQRIGYNVIGPLQKGKLYFELETSPVDLTKIPIKALFGLTTVLIVGKYHGQQFIRIGYFVEVRYPGIDSEKLIDTEELPVEEGEVEEEEEEEIEVMDEEEETGSEEDENSLVADDEDGTEEEAEEGTDDEGGENAYNEEESEASERLGNLGNVLASIMNPGAQREPMPCETPITADADSFEYKGFQLKQSSIEMELKNDPIIHVYEIDWVSNESENNELVESSGDSDSGCDGSSCETADDSKKLKTE